MERIKATLDRFEGDKGVLVFPEAQKLIVSRKYLPENAREGDVFVFTACTDQDENEKIKLNAKKILNEVLNHQPREF